MTLTAAYWIIIAAALWLIGISIFMILKPGSALSALGKMASTPFINLTELTIRFIVGLAFFHYAPETIHPASFRIFGGFLSATAVIILASPIRWHAAYAQWWAKRLPISFVRVAAPFSFAAGVFLIHALN